MKFALWKVIFFEVRKNEDLLELPSCFLILLRSFRSVFVINEFLVNIGDCSACSNKCIETVIVDLAVLGKGAWNALKTLIDFKRPSFETLMDHELKMASFEILTVFFWITSIDEAFL